MTPMPFLLTKVKEASPQLEEQVKNETNERDRFFILTHLFLRLYESRPEVIKEALNLKVLRIGPVLLCSAAKHGLFDLFQRLYKFGANPLAKNRIGKTPIDLATPPLYPKPALRTSLPLPLPPPIRQKRVVHKLSRWSGKYPKDAIRVVLQFVSLKKKDLPNTKLIALAHSHIASLMTDHLPVQLFQGRMWGHPKEETLDVVEETCKNAIRGMSWNDPTTIFLVRMMPNNPNHLLAQLRKYDIETVLEILRNKNYTSFTSAETSPIGICCKRLVFSVADCEINKANRETFFAAFLALANEKSPLAVELFKSKPAQQLLSFSGHPPESLKHLNTRALQLPAWAIQAWAGQETRPLLWRDLALSILSLQDLLSPHISWVSCCTKKLSSELKFSC